MLAQVQKGQIQCIAVKDLSRFGRDYLEVGNYITRIFPFLGIRFIAVNDGFDSIRPIEADSLAVSFKTMLSDLYSQDLSGKVKSAMRFKAQQGAFVSSFAPYGYMKDAQDKNRIVPDFEAAENVRRIFQMAAAGQSAVQIARLMNEERILTPMQYKCRHGCGRTVWNCIRRDNFWTQETVVKILRDERYTGKAVYGKKKRDEVGGLHQVQVKKDGWVTVDHAHTGIVSEEDFRRAQENMRIFSERGSRRDSGNLLKRKVRCGVCGRAMIRCGRKYPYYACHTPRVTDAYGCAVEKIPEADLIDIIQTAIQTQLLFAVDRNRIRQETYRCKNKNSFAAEKRASNLKKELARQENELQELYERYAFGGFGREEYMSIKCAALKRRAQIEKQMEELEENFLDGGRKYRSENSTGECFMESDEAADRMIIDELQSLARDGKIISDVLKEAVIYPSMVLRLVWNYRDDLMMRNGQEHLKK